MEKYEALDLEVIKFAAYDVLTSSEERGDDDLPAIQRADDRFSF